MLASGPAVIDLTAPSAVETVVTATGVGGTQQPFAASSSATAADPVVPQHWQDCLPASATSTGSSAMAHSVKPPAVGKTDRLGASWSTGIAFPNTVTVLNQGCSGRLCLSSESRLCRQKEVCSSTPIGAFYQGLYKVVKKSEKSFIVQLEDKREVFRWTD